MTETLRKLHEADKLPELSAYEGWRDGDDYPDTAGLMPHDALQIGFACGYGKGLIAALNDPDFIALIRAARFVGKVARNTVEFDTLHEALKPFEE